MVKFDHMTLPVSNSRASRDWYVANFGFKVEFEIPDRKTVALQDDAGFTIFLFEPQGGISGPKCGLTFQVNNVDEKYRELAARGVPFTESPKKLFWGYGAELRDPDGYQVMLWDEVSMRQNH